MNMEYIRKKANPVFGIYDCVYEMDEISENSPSVLACADLEQEPLVMHPFSRKSAKSRCKFAKSSSSSSNVNSSGADKCRENDSSDIMPLASKTMMDKKKRKSVSVVLETSRAWDAEAEAEAEKQIAQIVGENCIDTEEVGSEKPASGKEKLHGLKKTRFNRRTFVDAEQSDGFKDKNKSEQSFGRDNSINELSGIFNSDVQVKLEPVDDSYEEFNSSTGSISFQNLSSEFKLNHKVFGTDEDHGKKKKKSKLCVVLGSSASKRKQRGKGKDKHKTPYILVEPKAEPTDTDDPSNLSTTINSVEPVLLTPKLEPLDPDLTFASDLANTPNTSIKKKAKTRVLSCLFCCKTTTKMTYLVKHVIKYHPNIVDAHQTEKGKHVCSTCTGEFTDPSLFVTHLHKRPPTVECRVCDARFSTVCQGNQHIIEEKHGWMCLTCYHLFDVVNCLHECKPQVTFTCKICNKTFESISGINIHESLMHGESPTSAGNRVFGQKKMYTCIECGKTLGSKNDLKKHLRVHSNERPYTCPICSRSFKQMGHLTEHQEMHLQEKRFQCELCLTRFGYRSALKKHLLTQHTADTDKHFTCHICSERFPAMRFLNAHLKRKHDPGKSIICTVCGYTYTAQMHLTKHLYVVHGIDVRVRPKDKNQLTNANKMIVCDLCGATFTGRPQFSLHMLSKHAVDIRMSQVKKTSSYLPSGSHTQTAASSTGADNEDEEASNNEDSFVDAGSGIEEDEAGSEHEEDRIFDRITNNAEFDQGVFQEQTGDTQDSDIEDALNECSQVLQEGNCSKNSEVMEQSRVTSDGCDIDTSVLVNNKEQTIDNDNNSPEVNNSVEHFTSTPKEVNKNVNGTRKGRRCKVTARKRVSRASVKRKKFVYTSDTEDEIDSDEAPLARKRKYNQPLRRNSKLNSIYTENTDTKDLDMSDLPDQHNNSTCTDDSGVKTELGDDNKDSKKDVLGFVYVNPELPTEVSKRRHSEVFHEVPVPTS